MRRRNCGGRKGGLGGNKKDRISFHSHTYLWPTLPFRFPPFPEHPTPHTHTHILVLMPPSFTPKFDQMSHQEACALLQKDKNLKHFWKIFYEWLQTEVGEARRGEIQTLLLEWGTDVKLQQLRGRLLPWKPRGSADQPIIRHKPIQVVGHTQKDFKIQPAQRCALRSSHHHTHNARAPLHCVKANLGLGAATFRCIASWKLEDNVFSQ